MTAVYTWQWLLRLNYTPWAMFVDSWAKALIIIISSLHSFFKVPQRWSCTDRKQKWYTFQVSLQLIFLMLHVIVNLLSNLFFLSGFQYNYLKPYPSISLIHQTVVVYLLVPSLVQFLFQVCIARHWFYSTIFCSSCQT